MHGVHKPLSPSSTSALWLGTSIGRIMASRALPDLAGDFIALTIWFHTCSRHDTSHSVGVTREILSRCLRNVTFGNSNESSGTNC